MNVKYDERACKFNMDTGCVELLLRDGRKISIDCTGVEDALNVTMAQRSELDYLYKAQSSNIYIAVAYINYISNCGRNKSGLSGCDGMMER